MALFQNLHRYQWLHEIGNDLENGTSEFLKPRTPLMFACIFLFCYPCSQLPRLQLKRNQYSSQK